MDDRLFPQRTDFIVPLYPDVICSPESIFDFEDFICQCYGVPLHNILFADSGTLAFLLYLENISSKRQVIALPSFFCTQFALHCILEGHSLVLYDIAADLSIPDEAYDFAYEHSATVMIVPNFFGLRKHSDQNIKNCLEKGMMVLIDQAQSFPAMDSVNIGISHPNLLYLNSYGKSKPLGGNNGGALIRSEGKIPLITKGIKSTMYHRIKMFDKLHPLLENIIQSTEISDSEYFGFLEGDRCIWSKLLSDYIEKCSFLKKTWDLIKFKFPSDSVQFLLNCEGVPSVLALNSNNRYQVGKKLAKKGIQSTWYYYPLLNLSIFKDFPSQKPLNTNQISSSVIVVPWGIHHTETQIKYVIEEIINEF